MMVLDDMSTSLKDIARNTKDTKPLLEATDILKDIEGIGGPMLDRPFQTKFSMDLPHKTLEDFQVFDENLKADENARREFTSSLYFLLDRQNFLGKSATNILRRHMSRDVALRFTAQKKIADKVVLKDTTFCKCVVDVLLKRHTDGRGNPLTEKDVFTALGNSLTNAKDWDGYRAHRLKKKDEDS